MHSPDHPTTMRENKSSIRIHSLPDTTRHTPLPLFTVGRLDRYVEER